MYQGARSVNQSPVRASSLAFPYWDLVSLTRVILLNSISRWLAVTTITFSPPYTTSLFVILDALGTSSRRVHPFLNIPQATRIMRASLFGQHGVVIEHRNDEVGNGYPGTNNGNGLSFSPSRRYRLIAPGQFLQVPNAP